MKKMISAGVAQAQEMIPVALRSMNGDAGPLPTWFGDIDFSGVPTEKR